MRATPLTCASMTCDTLSSTAWPDAALLGQGFVVDDVDVGARLVDGDGGLRDGYPRRRVGILDDHAHGLAVGQRAVLVVERGAHDLAIGLGIDRDVDEVELAL